MKNLDMWGATPPVSYGTYERRAYTETCIYNVKEGKFNKISTVVIPGLMPEWEEYGLPGYKVKMD